MTTETNTKLHRFASEILAQPANLSEFQSTLSTHLEGHENDMKIWMPVMKTIEGQNALVDDFLGRKGLSLITQEKVGIQSSGYEIMATYRGRQKKLFQIKNKPITKLNSSVILISN